MEKVASDENLGDILNELGEYVTDIDTSMAELSIKAITGISVRLPLMSKPIIKQLSTFLKLERDYISN